MSTKKQKTQQVPVTVITGFLGSGKSTLLNHILTDKTHGKRFAIIENEVGDISIDHHILSHQSTDEEIIEVTNGCICCSIRGDLVTSLNKLYEKVSKFDGILIETTGLADPAPIVQTFFQDQEIQQKFQLNGVVTVVDAKHIIERLYEKKEDSSTTNEALEQIAFSDKVLLNKVDLVPDEKELMKIEDEIESINPTVDIVRTEHSRLKDIMKDLVHIGGFDIQRALDMDRFFLTKTRKHRPDRNVTTVSCEVEGEVNMEMLQQWVRRLLSADDDDEHDHDHDHDHHNPEDTDGDHNHATVMYRYKGLIAIKGMENKFIFQGVGMIFSGAFSPEKWGDSKRKSQFVFIGKHLNEQLLRDGFDACKVTQELRFQVGDNVEANLGRHWEQGTVVRHWDDANAYRVKLKSGEVWAPVDTDDYIRAASTST